MSKAAAAAYLQRLRELRGLSRAHVARLVGTSEMTIYRIESEAQEPKADALMAFLDVISGDVYDIYQLLRATDAPREDGERRADERAKNTLAAQAHERPKPIRKPQHPDSDLAQEIADLRRRITDLEDRLGQQTQPVDDSQHHHKPDESPSQSVPEKPTDAGLDPA
jgi:transcriptional regulator with XRE-family HTH domain